MQGLWASKYQSRHKDTSISVTVKIRNDLLLKHDEKC